MAATETTTTGADRRFVKRAMSAPLLDRDDGLAGDAELRGEIGLGDAALGAQVAQGVGELRRLDHQVMPAR